MKIDLENKIPVVGILGGVAVFFVLQMILPFPYGIVIGIVVIASIILWIRRQSFTTENSLLSYRRIDPKDDKERLQNKESRRILEKKFLEEKISKEEYERMKKEYEDNDKYDAKN